MGVVVQYGWGESSMKKRIACKSCSDATGELVLMYMKKTGVSVRTKNYIGYFMCDIMACPVCGREIFVGFGEEIIDVDRRTNFEYGEIIDR